MKRDHQFSIVLYQPEIPGNTGSIGRLCVALEIPLILIGPLGFDISQKAVRRAGLDYWKHVNMTVLDSWQDFISHFHPNEKQLLFFENFGEKNHYQADYPKDCFLVFGSETKGIPEDLLILDNTYRIPQYSHHIRSINLANAASVIAYQALYSQSFT